MNLHQFRFVQEAVRRDLNLTETAKALFTSQPGVSKAILELEGELRRAISVVKVRNSQHSKEIREYSIDSSGSLVIGARLGGYRGLLTGTPREGESRDESDRNSTSAR